MRRILKRGGLLIILNLDPGALTGVDRVRCLIRIPYHGITGYRLKPPRGFGKNTMTEKQLCDLLVKSMFQVISAETIKDTSCFVGHPSRIHQGCESLRANCKNFFGPANMNAFGKELTSKLCLRHGHGPSGVYVD